MRIRPFEGEFVVAITHDGTSSELSVRDRAPAFRLQFPRIFERFHRIEGTRSRTHEGFPASA